MVSVWQHSEQSGTALLMLLAIADNANEYGEAWPAVGTLATKCRMSIRNAQALLSKLDESGELVIGRQAGQPTPAGPTNLYTIVTPGAQRREGVKPTAPLSTNGVKPTAPQGVKPSVARGEVQRSEGVKPTAPKPSLNRQEPISPPLTPPRGQVREEEEEEEETIEKDDGKADLIDGLIALRIYPNSAAQVVANGTVSSDRDLVLCKRFAAANPPGVLWSQYLSIGRLPPGPAPDASGSSVTSDQIAAARRMLEESERMQQTPAEFVGPAGIAAAIAGATMRSFPKKREVAA